MVGGKGTGASNLVLAQRLAFGAAFGGAGGGLFQRAFGRLPVGEDAGDRCVGGLAGELGGVEHLVADDDARARPLLGLICRELVARPLIASHFAFAPLGKFNRVEGRAL